MLSFPILSPQDWFGIVVRLGTAMLVGAAIGLEREAKNKAAGLRTHMLISLGAAIFTLIPILLDVVEQNPNTLSRVIQGVATGVGFLGAGEILQESLPQSGKYRVRGLTSAAAIWVSAALGVAAGCGLWPLSLMGTGFTLLILRGVKKLEQRMK